jgi:hypothetical protein
VLILVAAAISSWLLVCDCFGQNETAFSITQGSDERAMLERLEQLESIVHQLQCELAANSKPDRLATPLSNRLEENGATAHSDLGAVECDPCESGPSHFLIFDQGWALRPYDAEATPFEIKFNIHNQFRYTGFARSVTESTDSAGRVRQIQNRNDFDINRGRFVFSGYAFDPRFKFYTNIDYNTVAQNPILLLLSWFSVGFSESFNLYAGLGKVPGTWEWLESSRFTLGAERTLATTFFRPSITAGIWASGKLGDSTHYRFLVGDGFNTFTLRASQLDANLAYSGSVWFEPRGEFGVGFSDLECHEKLAVRFGNGFTFASNDSEPSGDPGPEQTVIRLSDGTRLVDPGALAPGVMVNGFDISLYTVHLGVKYRGASFSSEYYLRWLNSLEATGPLPVDSLFDHGYFVQGGMFVIPKKLELFARGSQVKGDFGDGSEVSAGCNWYIKGQRGARCTLDVAAISDSPAQQNRTGFVAGASGTLFRVQCWSFF